MGTAREPTPSTTIVDDYSSTYYDLFEDVRSSEHLCSCLLV
jgi:hypothetical protein